MDCAETTQPSYHVRESAETPTRLNTRSVIGYVVGYVGGLSGVGRFRKGRITPVAMESAAPQAGHTYSVSVTPLIAAAIGVAHSGHSTDLGDGRVQSTERLRRSYTADARFQP